MSSTRTNAFRSLPKLATLLRFLEYVSERCDLFLRGKLVVLRGTSSAVGYLAMGSSVSRVDSNNRQVRQVAIFLFSFWKTNFVTICKLCDWREKQKALDYIFEYFCCSFFFSDVKNVYFKKVWSIYFFLMLIRILIINP